MLIKNKTKWERSYRKKLIANEKMFEQEREK